MTEASDHLYAMINSEEWSVMRRLIQRQIPPPETSKTGRKQGRPPTDHRLVMCGLLETIGLRMHGLESWRNIDKRYGRWNTIYRLFRLWSIYDIWPLLILTEEAQSIFQIRVEIEDNGMSIIDRKTIISVDDSNMTDSRKSVVITGIIALWSEASSHLRVVSWFDRDRPINFTLRLLGGEWQCRSNRPLPLILRGEKSWFDDTSQSPNSADSR